MKWLYSNGYTQMVIVKWPAEKEEPGVPITMLKLFCQVGSEATNGGAGQSNLS